MNASARLSDAAFLISDPSRAVMLWSLVGGETRPASELAMLANVSPQTASNHLKLLLEAGFLRVAASGRNKFYRLAGPAIAEAIEALAAAIPAPARAEGTAQHIAPELVFARTCYDHLAGELGVAILQRLLDQDHLIGGGKNFELSVRGEKFLHDLQIDVRPLRAQRRRFAYPCLDWSQRVPHLGGALGAALLEWMLHSRLAARRRTGRALRLTELGEKRLRQLFGIRLARDGRTVAA